MLKLYNTLTRKKGKFVPLKDKKATLYVCGITPYDTTHLGHAFTYISFDVLVRYLKFKGYEVTYTQNVTDMNDRDNDILARAKKLNIPWTELVNYWTNRFLNDMQALNWIKPSNYLWASKNIPEMIILIKKLLKNGYAYEVSGSVYLDVAKKKDFGKLSRYSVAEMLRVAKDFEEDLTNSDKRHPLDITLWRATEKNQEPHIPSFESPFGKGRPGWHIECSAMVIKTLGSQIDIHGGGHDLIYPHHESEIAQSEGATGIVPFVSYWLHTGTVHYQVKKMSKSLGNLVLVSDLLKKYSANAIRYLLLSHHYREPWEFFEKDLIVAEQKIKVVEKRLVDSSEGKEEFEQAMNNDLDSPSALKILDRKPSLEIYKALGFISNF